jgi:cobyric acid synthase
MNGRGFAVYAEPWQKNPEPIFMARAPVPVESHIQNFLDCVKSRRQPNCTVEVAAPAVAGPHLANLAMFKGMKAKLAEATKTS